MGMSVVQRLYELCKETFLPGGVVPPPPAIARMTAFLDTIKAVDVGLDEGAITEMGHSGPTRRRRQYRRSRTVTSLRPRQSPPVTYILIHECSTFSIGIFCLPSSAVIPLHDHAQMTVFSKILCGSMHIKAYDWLTPQPQLSFKHHFPLDLKLAALKVDGDFRAPCETSVLYPTSGGNIHSFTALTSCAVLDVLSPPYSGEPSYYIEYPCPDLPGNVEDRDSEEYVWLEQREKPKSFCLIPHPYRGPRIDFSF
ncbi:hypothetical protein SUGI_0990200 [Cryptomeria japonica]|uniref:plant cysteine oxidase 1 n=1 Tax=Cryptomeria japonica TaxID=3369 RepID=UPI0024147B07|nr:plant cysteine oxidase 1 [Cryptomeria japonica]GLJ46923.1 hypothetical protein SUGI_0990200 [Cryptomeria japonica]